MLADTPGGRADRTVIVGAHLDSVAEGPGINDNGSGSAAILETALQMAELGIQPTNRVRFAFWGGEEDGLIGSDYYVSQLDARALKQHAVNLNFDMVGSPNFVRFVYDGDGSAFGATGPNGSRASSGCSSTTSPRRVWRPNRPSSTVAPTTSPSSTTAYRPVASSPGPRASRPPSRRRSTAARQAWPMTRATTRPATPSTNLSNTALDQMSDAIAHSTLTFAMTTSAINGTAKSGSGGTIEFAQKGNRAIK